jgi:hypothetical protein
MFQRFKTFLKEIDGSIWFYLSLLAASLFFLRLTFFVHPDTSGDFWGNARIEFVGFCLDVFLLGLIFSIFMQRYQWKQDIKRWQEEIDDYRRWDEKEAMFRIVGNIKRLNRAGVTKIDLSGCYLRGANLSDLNLRGSIFFDADLRGVDFSYTNLDEVRFGGTDLKESILIGTTFKNASFAGVNLDDAKVREPWWFKDLKEMGVKQADILSEIYEIAYDNENSIDVLKRRSKT